MIKKSTTVKNLGIFMNLHVNYSAQINSIVRKCNISLRTLYLLKTFLDKETLLTEVHALVSSNIDHCNGIFYGIPTKNIFIIAKNTKQSY